MRRSSAFKIICLSLWVVIATGLMNIASAAPELPTLEEVIESGIAVPEGNPGLIPRDPRPTIFQSTRRSLSDSLDFIEIEDSVYRQRLARIKNAGFYEVKGQEFGGPVAQELIVLPVDDSFYHDFVNNFLYAVSKEKLKIMRAFKISNSEYNRLAVLSFGILGMESKFGESAKYKFKESCQTCITGAKAGRRFFRNILQGEFQAPRFSSNSRGPTQIKELPAEIRSLYPQITPDTLTNPQHAGIATVGFLAARLNDMKVRVAANRGKDKNYDYINQSNVYDYVMYAYFGSMDEVFKNTATPALNPYISGNHRDPEKSRSGLRDYIRFLTLLER